MAEYLVVPGFLFAGRDAGVSACLPRCVKGGTGISQGFSWHDAITINKEVAMR